jgi:hypothetical protein
MPRTWRAAGLAVCVAALVAAPARSGEVDDLKSEIESLRQSIDKLNRELKVPVETLAERVKTLTNLEARVGENEKAVNELRGQVQILRDEVLRLRADLKGPEQPRVARAFTPTPLTGVVRVTNTAPFRATVFLNGVAYDVPANRFLDIVDVPAGPFTYEVALDFYGIIKPRTQRVLAAAQTFPINISYR